jgi:hypothetical protein
VNVKHRLHVISSRADIARLSPDVSAVHFRKFVSRAVLKEVLASCKRLKIISLSRYAAGRLGSDIIEEVSARGLSVHISQNEAGRPSAIEKAMRTDNINMGINKEDK